ncbi:MAG: EVE domain-containing protein [Parachlamydiales bacterium]|nr:EVE domain-containing protein [Parachlamydiales bacterium]
MRRYWMGVASHEHVQKAKAGGFAQVCHGKMATLKHMSEGDGMIYYSPTYHFGGNDPCRCFTAIGVVEKGDPYLFKMAEDFIPWRKNIQFFEANDAPIGPLLVKLTFIKDKKKWGFPFRRGSFEIPQIDFELIAKSMGL